jgi:integrase
MKYGCGEIELRRSEPTPPRTKPRACASSLVAGWWGRPWRLEMVRDVLGHSSVTVTERYAHLSPSVLDEAGAASAIPEMVPAFGRRDLEVAEFARRAT